MHFRMRTVAILTLTVLTTTSVDAQDRKATEAVSFERDAKPIFRKRCANCRTPFSPNGL